MAAHTWESPTTGEVLIKSLGRFYLTAAPAGDGTAQEKKELSLRAAAKWLQANGF
jgi:alpha-L-fucosidase